MATLAIALAAIREWRRQAFVRVVEAGRAPGFRMIDTDEGRALLRLVPRGVSYRVVDVEREVGLFDTNSEFTAPSRRPIRSP